MSWLGYEEEVEEQQQQPSPQEQTFSDTCCGRFTAELNPCQPHWQVRDRATGRDLDVPESFAPPGYLVGLWKAVCTGLSFFTMIYTWVEQADNFYLAFLSHWGVVFCCLYFGCSFWNTLWAERTPQPTDKVGWRIRITWILAELAAYFEGIIVVMFWVAVYDWGSSVSFFDIANHGVLAVLVWIDVFIVNRIPFRWMHWTAYLLPVSLLYVLWTVLHSFVGDLGNPNDPESDLLYDFVDWDENWQKSAIVSAIVVFGLGPVVFMVLWLVSIYQWPCCCRKDKRFYLDSFKDNQNETGPTVNDVEEGSIFAKWW